MCSPSNCATTTTGQVSWTYTSNGTPGTDTIQACYPLQPLVVQRPLDEARQCRTVTKTWTAGQPVTLTLTPTTATNVVGAAHCVTATVKDSFGNPTPGITVVFSVPTAGATHA